DFPHPERGAKRAVEGRNGGRADVLTAIGIFRLLASLRAQDEVVWEKGRRTATLPGRRPGCRTGRWELIPAPAAGGAEAGARWRWRPRAGPRRRPRPPP